MFHQSVSQTKNAINSVRSKLCAWLALSALSICSATASPVSLTISPNTISNDYAGAITLQINGLNTGETVIVERFSDFNGDGTPDSQDMTLAAFPIKDGEAVVFGGVTNLHVPGDLNANPGSITANLYLNVMGFEQRSIGKDIYRVSSPTSRFTPVTAPFTVTNSPYASQVTGLVQSSGTNVPYALVVLFKPSANGVTPQLCGASDATGKYNLQAPPGTYLMAAFKSNYVCDLSAAPPMTLTSGTTSTNNLSLAFATRRISGRISDPDDPLHGLGGLLTVAQSATFQLAVGFTDRNGSFSIGVAPGIYEVGPNEEGVNFLGYVAHEAWAGADCTAADVTGLSMTLPEGRAMVYGTVSTDTSAPMPDVVLFGQEEAKSLSLTPTTDYLGRYFTPVVAGSWEIGVSHDKNPAYAGYLFSSPVNDLTVQEGATIQHNFTGKVATYLISGFLKNSSQVPLEGINIWITATIGGVEYNNRATTDSSGFFSMPAFNGIWTVGAACDGNEGLRPRGYRCMGNTQVTVANANAAVTLTVEPCTSLQIVTGSLPNGRVNQFYSEFLAADTCNNSVSWSLASGSGALPPGLSLLVNGQIAGTPTQYGQWSFTVQANDGSATVTKPLSLQIENTSMPLYIANGSLPDGTNGVSYSLHLDATGGQPPYTWSLAPGSDALPNGLTLSTNGYVTGTPGQTGQFYFWARVTDTTASNSDKLLAIYIVANPGLSTPPVLASSAIGTDGKFQFLVNGNQGVLYTVQVSTNLQNWSPLRSTNAPSNSFMFIGDAPSGPVLFYRILVGQ